MTTPQGGRDAVPQKRSNAQISETFVKLFNKTKIANRYKSSSWQIFLWSHLGLNQGLPDYESGALTN